MLFTCIKSWFFRNHLANFHQISHWSFCWNVIDSLFKWSCSIDCQAHIFFFKTKNCSNDDIFISCDNRIGKMLHNICMSAVAMSLRWANRGPWASCFVCFILGSKKKKKKKKGFGVSCKLGNSRHQISVCLLEKTWEKNISKCRQLNFLPSMLSYNLRSFHITKTYLYNFDPLNPTFM